MDINGRTKIVGIIGSPVEHTLSPVMHNAAFEKLGMNWVYMPFLVHTQNLAKALMGMRALGLVGLNVTLPHKESVIEFLDEIDEYAKKIGAVNTILNKDGKLYGYNTDCQGFLDILDKHGNFNPQRKNAVLIGAGGAGRSLAVGLAKKGIKKIIIFDVVKRKAEILSEKIRKEFGCATSSFEIGETRSLFWAISESDILLNATPVGMNKNEKLPISPRCLHKNLFVFDVIYRDTGLIKMARRKKLRCLNGLGMLVNQAARSFSIWTGKKAPVDIMTKAVLINYKGA